MKRPLCLLSVLALVAGCDPGSGPAESGPRGGRVPVEAESKPPVSPPTGIVRIQEAHDLYKEEVAAIEKALGDEGAPNANQLRTLRQIRRGLGHLKTAATLGRENQNRENLRNAHGLLLQEQSQLLRKRRQLWVEITEIEQYLDEIEKGTGSPPEGFTEPELKDRLVDAKRRDENLVAEQEVLQERMADLEGRIDAGDYSSGERSLFSDELEGLERLEGRITALLERAG